VVVVVVVVELQHFVYLDTEKWSKIGFTQRKFVSYGKMLFQVFDCS